MTGSNVRAVLMNVTAPETRGSAFAIYNLMDDLGKARAPARPPPRSPPGPGPTLAARAAADAGRRHR